MPQLSPITLFPDLTCIRIRMTFTAEQYRSRLRGHLGSMWRGAAGHQFMAICCPFNKPECNKCAENPYCLYSMLFQPVGNESGFSQPPPPWVIKITPATDNNQMYVYLTLIGSVCEHTTTIIEAFRNAGNAGLGKRNLNASLLKIEQLDSNTKQPWHTIDAQHRPLFPPRSISELLSTPVAPPSWEIATYSPIRIKKRVDCDIWSSAFLSLGQRLTMWQIFCGGTRMTKHDWLQCKQFLTSTHIQHNQLHHTKWHRYSQRQQKYVPVSGWSGSASVMPPSQLREIWWQWWQLADLFHLGKGINMGLGAIDINGKKLPNLEYKGLLSTQKGKL